MFIWGEANTKEKDVIILSDRAAKKVASILSKEADGAKLRIAVAGGGCSGFQYMFDIVTEEAKADDLVLARDGAIVLIDPVSQEYMADSEIDYTDELIGAAFKINNPLATASCGCGTSFAL
ncbi:MAG: HesB/IscA family protein [bacterium]